MALLYYNPTHPGHYPPETLTEKAYWTFRAWEDMALEEEEYARQQAMEEEAAHMEYHSSQLEWFEYQHLA
ncbi:hypothetical protein Q5H92_14525 [Hymenobacter sp. M29]|uniref:Uncharacterized protein n=1 Tax=Hymenobacter mellowenesis TaxID=3063995 RepID=A0ABT9AFX4_9BACT|nr:hypothetical protein [Hymenobacter sp. M29]MDO7847582.1 hypothetical protein [Hymenobacter sp. M29]